MGNTDIGGECGEGRRPEGGGASPKELVRDAAQAVKQETASFAADAREKAAVKVDEKKEAASQTLGDFASAIRTAGDQLAESDQSMATHLLRQAADGLEGLARSIADKRPEEMLEAVRDFGRRHPTAFVAGSVLAGVAIGRLLRSSGAHGSEASGSRAQTGDITAPGGSSAYPLTDVEAADPTVLGAEDFSLPTDGEAFAPTGADPAGEPRTTGADDRFGSRS